MSSMRMILAACLAAVATSVAAQPAPAPIASISASTCQFASGRKALLADRTADAYLLVLQRAGEDDLHALIVVNADDTVSVGVEGQAQQDHAQGQAIEALFQELRIMPRQQITRAQFATYLQTAVPLPCAHAEFRDYYPAH
ncbi:MAG: hypothetical protein ABUS57_21630 [Pseudomonadota bacterium]